MKTFNPADPELEQRVAIALCEASGGIPLALDKIKHVTKDMIPPDEYDKTGHGCYFYWRVFSSQAKEVLETIGVYLEE